MSRSDKSTINSRVNDIMRLLVVGAGLPEILQFASNHGWNVTERQVRRYQELAYRQLAKTAYRNRKQLLGRHLQQRRTLFARCIKENDNRTALYVLKDEADLEGLYPNQNQDEVRTAPVGDSPLSRRERTVRLLVAEAQGNRSQIALLEHATPCHNYLIPDTSVPQGMLHVLALTYVSEQLEMAALCINAMFCQMINPDQEQDRERDSTAKAAAYMYRIGHDAWRQFVESLGLDPTLLVDANYRGCMLAFCDENVCAIAPAAEEMQAILAQSGYPDAELTTAADLLLNWRRLFAPVCHE
jgi:hypothetical protein